MHENDILATAQKHHQAGEIQIAENNYRRLLDVNPGNEAALYGMAVLNFQSGRIEDAAIYAERLVSKVPNNAQAHFTLGSILKAQGNKAGAIKSLEMAATCDPDNPVVLCTLGAAFRDDGNFAKAVEYYAKATRLRPDDEVAWSNLANASWQEEQFDKAIDAFRTVVRLKPEQAYAHNNLGHALFENGEYDAAIASHRRVADITHSPGATIRLNTLLPMIAESQEQIETLRNQLNEKLSSMLDAHPIIGNPIEEIGKTNFLLAYHGRNDKELQIKFAELYRKACPSLSMTASHCQLQKRRNPSDRIRVGFISKFFKNHSIGRTSKGIIEFLSRDRFHVLAIFLDPPADETARAIAKAADEILILPNDLESARRDIAAKELDILFYQDIGMDAFTYFLSFARLAPVQCTSFGHPVTTGVPTIDYYISTDYWEPDDATKHYSERLLCLKDVGSVAYYYKPTLPSPLKPRKHFGLNDHDHVYICPQALFKFHPEFDRLLVEILRRDPAGKLVLVDGLHRHWSDILYDRLKKTGPDVADRIQFLPRQQSIDFINLIAVADVMLDTIHFCGFNTTLEAFAAGIPVVTLSGEFMRSRHTAAFYRKMNISECVASGVDDYVDKAVRLGCDRSYRDSISEKIKTSGSLIWEEIRIIREFERVFEEMLVKIGEN